jgi:hypothetical protein
MKAAIIFSGSSPILILTSYDSLAQRKFIEKLRGKGIRKFIAYEVPAELVKKKYGVEYDVVMNDLRQEDDLRVMDYDGQSVVGKFSFDEMGEPTYCE